MAEPIRHALLEEVGVEHGFGVKDSVAAADLQRPIQVHGRVVVNAGAGRDVRDLEADAVVCMNAGVAIGVVTADCLPILACSEDGSAVAAIHAGWRGLAAGVVAAGIEALRGLAPGNAALRAVVGPLLTALEGRFGRDALSRSKIETRPGHARIDLWELAQIELLSLGIPADSVACIGAPCTCCDPLRFHSYRRDSTAAGRLVHSIAAC